MYDGSGLAPVIADLGIKGDRIETIGDLDDHSAVQFNRRHDSFTIIYSSRTHHGLRKFMPQCSLLRLNRTAFFQVAFGNAGSVGFVQLDVMAIQLFGVSVLFA